MHYLGIEYELGQLIDLALELELEPILHKQHAAYHRQ